MYDDDGTIVSTKLARDAVSKPKGVSHSSSAAVAKQQPAKKPARVLAVKAWTAPTKVKRSASSVHARRVGEHELGCTAARVEEIGSGLRGNIRARSASSRLSDLAQRVRPRTGPAEGSPDSSARSL